MTVPHQCYRHSTTRLLSRGKLLSQISLIMIVDVSGHLCFSSGTLYNAECGITEYGIVEYKFVIFSINFYKLVKK